MHLLFNDKSFRLILIIQLILSLVLPFLGYFSYDLSVFLLLELLCLALFSIRTPYGLDGAHHMNLILIGSLCLTSFFDIHSKIALFCMWFVSAQIILAYFIAGIKKLLSPIWYSGDALTFIFRTEAYGHPWMYRLIEKRPILRKSLAWGVISFETLFPLVAFGNSFTIGLFLSIGIVFHLMNAFLLGLNNFTFAFIATYPILVFSIKATDFTSYFVPLLFYIVFPILLIAWLWNSTQSIKRVLLKSCIAITYIVNLLTVGFAPILGIGYYGKYFFLSFFSFAFIAALVKANKNKQPKKVTKQSIFGYSLLIIFSLFMCLEVQLSLKGHKMPDHTIELEFPLNNGSYYIAQGGNHSIINHHQKVLGQKFAIDVVKLNKYGFHSHSLLPTCLSDYNVYGTNVYSPESGTVIKVVDQHEDLVPPLRDQANPAGNHIVFRIENTNYGIVLAHLQYQSIQVKVGDSITKGQLLGKVGNSGNTTEPHLHMHCVAINDQEDFLYDAEPIPMTFDHKFLSRNHICSK